MQIIDDALRKLLQPNIAIEFWPWPSRIDYFENNRQNLSSHLEPFILKNSLFLEIPSSRWQKENNWHRQLIRAILARKDIDQWILVMLTPGTWCMFKKSIIAKKPTIVHICQKHKTCPSQIIAYFRIWQLYSILLVTTKISCLLPSLRVTEYNVRNPDSNYRYVYLQKKIPFNEL